MIVNNIVTYIRTASHDENAVMQQRTQLNEFVAELNENGAELNVAEIVDIGYSGLTNERPGITEIFAKLESGEIDMLVTTDPMRLHRNLTEVQRLISQLDEYGLIVEFASNSQILQEEDGVAVNDTFAETMHKVIAQNEREMRSQRIKDGIKRQKESGK
jgi:DNA invertase Pin-like site-specific DNA recombinase